MVITIDGLLVRGLHVGSAAGTGSRPGRLPANAALAGHKTRWVNTCGGPDGYFPDQPL